MSCSTFSIGGLRRNTNQPLLLVAASYHSVSACNSQIVGTVLPCKQAIAGAAAIVPGKEVPGEPHSAVIVGQVEGFLRPLTHTSVPPWDPPVPRVGLESAPPR